jgi:hypothetical protein
MGSFEPGISVIVAFAATILAGPQLAEAGKIAPIARWGGQAGKVGSGDSGYICNQYNLKEFWQKWEIAKPTPQIDFNRELAVFYLGSGGPHLMNLSLEESGNLVAEYVQTPTASRQPNYLIFTVPRYGVKSLNGIPIMCSD